MHHYKYYILCLGLISITAGSYGCGVTLNPVKREPLRIIPLQSNLPIFDEKPLIYFLPTLSDKKLSETIWDNISGPLWDPEESTRIGYTQYYGAFIVQSRIFIPFGRIFSEVFISGIKNSFSNFDVCFYESCESQNLKSLPFDPIIKIEVKSFSIWEGPLNHLNFKATVTAKVRKKNKNEFSETTYVSTKELTGQSLGSSLTTSSGFIDEMNQLANRFAADITLDILKNGYNPQDRDPNTHTN